MRKLPENFGQGHKFDRKNNEDHRNHQKTIDKHIKLHQQDWQDVVVCNMHPYPIQSHFGDAGLLNISACREGEPYNAHVIDMYRITKSDLGNGQYDPIEILPVEQAIEIEKKYALSGGVFWYFAGEKVPTDKLKQAKETQIAYYKGLVRKAKDEWSRYHNNARIGDNQRNAARYLARIGELNANTLEWVEKTKLPICPQCGEDVKPEAKVCKECEFPLNVEWVRKFRKDLVAKFNLGEADEATVEVGSLPAPADMNAFLDEGINEVE